MKRLLVIATLIAPIPSHAQGPPPFDLGGPGSASQLVDIQPSVKQDDGSHDIEIWPVLPDGGKQTRSQSGAGSEHGRLWTVPGSTSYAILPNISSAPLPQGSGFRSFLVFEDPITTPGPLAPFLLVGEHYYDAQCSTATCGFLDGGLQGEAESSFNVVGGAITVHVDTDTPAYGRRYYDAAPSGGDIYNHLVEATAAAAIEDWVYVTGAGPTATLIVQATLSGALDTPAVPVNEEDWTTPVYGDVRDADPCSDQVMTSKELLRPEGGQSDRLGVLLSIASGYQETGGSWVPALVEGQGFEVERRFDLVWVEEEGFPGCSGETLEVHGETTGVLAPSLMLQVAVPTNQWTRVSASATAEARCIGPFACNLHAIMPAQLQVTSPNGTLVAWHGIAGLTRVPEPEYGIAAALAALTWMRSRRC